MPNKLGGNKYKKGKKGSRDRPNEPIPYADEIDGCYYGQIIKRIGTGFHVMINGKQETATICGKMRNRQWCNPGDVVMVNLDLDKYIITHKYNVDAVKQLKSLGKINFTNTNENDSSIVFEDDDSSEDNDVHNIMDNLKKSTQNPEKNAKIIVAGNTGKNDENNDSGSNSGSESESELTMQEDKDKDNEKDQEKKIHKLTKQFKNKSRSDKIVAEINIAENRNNKTTRSNDDDWIDDI